jgi:hypothetical protein
MVPRAGEPPRALLDPIPAPAAALGLNVDAERPFLRWSGLVFAASPSGSHVIAHDPVTRKDKSLALSPSGGSPHKVSFVKNESSGRQAGLVALRLQGPKISRIAVYDVDSGTWYPQDLSEPFSGVATPTVQTDTVGYDLGHRAYTFSSKTGKWDVLDIGSIPDAPEDGNSDRAKPRN